MKKEGYCEHCDDFVNLNIVSRELEGMLEGHKYPYPGQVALCEQCGAEIWLPELNDLNLASLYRVYRKENGIISLEDIRALPEKYNIGKRPLSLLLGWGEITFTRYYDGAIPSRSYADQLQHLLNEPAYYAELLEANRAQITDSAYRKSRRAVQELLMPPDDTTSKLDGAARYFLSAEEMEITPMALQKALYYAQGLHYAFSGDFMFEEPCEAWRYGPVFERIYQKYKHFGCDGIARIRKPDPNRFTELELAILHSVAEHVLCYSGSTLANWTHREAPWLQARGDLQPDERSRREIQKPWIADYFTKLKAEYAMATPDDFSRYTKARFNER